MSDMLCPIAGCRNPITNRIVMCPKHWQRVPGPMKTRVYKAWKDRKADPADRVKTREHLDAKAQAIAAVTAQEAA